MRIVLARVPRSTARLEQHWVAERVVELSGDRQRRREPTHAVLDRRHDVQDHELGSNVLARFAATAVACREARLPLAATSTPGVCGVTRPVCG
ncbi:MAG TPA: hypothetical protein VIX82_18400 [Solirubrobacteraceae bacterium]